MTLPALPRPATDPAPSPRGGAFDPQLYRLLAWHSPNYPTGAFSYSHGLEWAVEAGRVHDLETLTDYVQAVVRYGGGWVDAVLFARIFETVGDDARCDPLIERAGAFRGSAETALEAHQQGDALLRVTRAAWPHPALDALARRFADRPLAHCAVAAVAARAHGMALEPSLAAYVHAAAANLVSAGVRLVPLGQTDGQIALARLLRTVQVTCTQADVTAADALGTAAPWIELCCLHHETQYTRLFRS